MNFLNIETKLDARGGVMDKKIIRLMGVVLQGLMAVTILSCAHGTAERNNTAISEEEHGKILERYKVGVEESKKFVVAQVNGTDITMNQLIDRMNKIAPTYVKDPRERTPELDDKVKQEALDILIFRELAIQDAVRQGMKADPAQIDRSIETLRHVTGTEEGFNAYLSQRGLTEESLRKEIERDELFNMVAEKEIAEKMDGSQDRAAAIQKRKEQWEAELKKKATIVISLEEVERKLREEPSDSHGK